MSNNAAERELRAVAVGRRNWTFAGSDEGGRRAAAIYTLIATAKLNDVDPQAWLADVLARLSRLGSGDDGGPCARSSGRYTNTQRGCTLRIICTARGDFI
jgi:transposase